MYGKEHRYDYGRPNTPELFQELVEATPQIPIHKIGQFAKAGVAKIREIAEDVLQETEPVPQAKPKRGV